MSAAAAFSSVRLYSYWRSSSAWRVRIALAHKGIAYQNVPVNLAPSASEQRTAAFREVNALEQIPVLAFEGGALDGRRLTQSMAIVELLEELVGEPPLLPRDPWERAVARMLAEIVNSGTQPLQNLKLLGRIRDLGGDAQAWAREVIASGLSALEREARGSSGRFLVGDRPSIADLYLVPQLYNARRFSLPLEAFPTLAAIDARCASLPAFADSHPDRMPDAPAS